MSHNPGFLVGTVCLIGLLIATFCLAQKNDSQCEKYKILGSKGENLCGCPTVEKTEIAKNLQHFVGYGVINDIILPASDAAQQGAVIPLKLPFDPWQGGIVFYTIDKAFDLSFQTIIRESIAMIESMVGTEHIEFKEALTKSGEICRKNYVRIESNSEKLCTSMVGMQRNKPTNITLDATICNQHYKVMHEILHTLGLAHEQVRPMRDSFLTVNLSKIYTPYCQNFQRRTMDVFEGLPFDILSIMQYESCAGSCDGSPVLLNKSNGQILPANKNLSQGDVQKIRKLYPAAQKVRYSDSLCRDANEPDEHVVVKVSRPDTIRRPKSSCGISRSWNPVALVLVAVATGFTVRFFPNVSFKIAF